jgi:hypothetical protein
MKREVFLNGKLVPKDQEAAILIPLSDRMRARSLQRRLERAIKRNPTPERQSVAIAMLIVEEKIVSALWTIARQPLGRTAPLQAARCGLDYIHDRLDIHSIYADAAGGKWDTIAPRPALPSSREITVADQVQDWLLLLDDEFMRKLLVVGATSKRGQVARQINWIRIREGMKELDGMSERTLRHRYQEALRIIVSELTIARIA